MHVHRDGLIRVLETAAELVNDRTELGRALHQLLWETLLLQLSTQKLRNTLCMGTHQ
jgi:hypothetical protein